MILHPQHMPETNILELSEEDSHTLKRMLLEEWVYRTLHIDLMTDQQLHEMVAEINAQDFTSLDGKA